MEPELSEAQKANLFRPGNTLGGRRKGSVGGRVRALMVLDAMLNEEGNLEHLRAAPQANFSKDPIRFFCSFIMPLLP